MTDYAEPSWAVPCPVCTADVGDPCRSSLGKSVRTHSDRERLSRGVRPPRREYEPVAPKPHPQRPGRHVVVLCQPTLEYGRRVLTNVEQREFHTMSAAVAAATSATPCNRGCVFDHQVAWLDARGVFHIRSTKHQQRSRK